MQSWSIIPPVITTILEAAVSNGFVIKVEIESTTGKKSAY
jgi:hypothetical protein